MNRFVFWEALLENAFNYWADLYWQMEYERATRDME